MTGLDIFIDCDNSGCDTRQQVFSDELPKDWEKRGDIVICPRCAWLIATLEDIQSEKITMDQAVDRILSGEGRP
jgi:hypothetical protein